MASHLDRYHDTTLAQKALLVLVAVVLGLVAATLALTFQVKIVIGLIAGLCFGALILLKPLVGMVFLLITMPVLEIFPSDFFGSGLLNPTNLILATITVSVTLYRTFVLKIGISRRSWVAPILVYGIVLTFSIGLNLIKGEASVAAVAGLTRTYLNGAYLYFLTTNCIESERDARYIFYTVLFTVIFVALWGLFEYRNDILAGMASSRVRISGRVGQPNSFGAFLCYYLPFLIGALRVRNVPRLWRLYALGGTVAVLFALMFTQSRGAYLGLVCSLVFLAVAVNRRLLLVMLVAGLLHPLWLPSQVVERIQYTFDGQGAYGVDSSSESRIKFYKAGVRLWTESPVWGHGFGGFSRMSAERGITETRRAAHSLYIQMLVDTGLVGLTAIFYMWGHLWRRSWRLWKTATDPSRRIFGECFLACLVAIVMVNIFGIRFYNFMEIGYFWALCAVLVFYTEPARDRIRAGSEARRAA